LREEIICLNKLLAETYCYNWLERQDLNLRPSAPKALDQQNATAPMRTKCCYDFSLKYLLSKWVSRIVLYAAKCCKVKHL